MNVVTAIVNSAIDVIVEKKFTGRTASSKACLKDESLAKSRAESTAVNMRPVAIAWAITYTHTAIENTESSFDGRREKAEKEAAKLAEQMAAQEAIDAEKRAARKERKQLTKEEQKARRDARYAARKARR